MDRLARRVNERNHAPSRTGVLLTALLAWLLVGGNCPSPPESQGIWVYAPLANEIHTDSVEVELWFYYPVKADTAVLGATLFEALDTSSPIQTDVSDMFALYERSAQAELAMNAPGLARLEVHLDENADGMHDATTSVEFVFAAPPPEFVASPPEVDGTISQVYHSLYVPVSWQVGELNRNSGLEFEVPVLFEYSWTDPAQQAAYERASISDKAGVVVTVGAPDYSASGADILVLPLRPLVAGSLANQALPESVWLRTRMETCELGSSEPCVTETHSEWVLVPIPNLDLDDAELDGVADSQDSCPSVFNPTQVDYCSPSLGDLPSVEVLPAPASRTYAEFEITNARSHWLVYVEGGTRPLRQVLGFANRIVRVPIHPHQETVLVFFFENAGRRSPAATYSFAAATPEWIAAEPDEIATLDVHPLAITVVDDQTGEPLAGAVVAYYDRIRAATSEGVLFTERPHIDRKMDSETLLVSADGYLPRSANLRQIPIQGPRPTYPVSSVEIRLTSLAEGFEIGEEGGVFATANIEIDVPPGALGPGDKLTFVSADLQQGLMPSSNTLPLLEIRHSSPSHGLNLPLIGSIALVEALFPGTELAIVAQDPGTGGNLRYMQAMVDSSGQRATFYLEDVTGLELDLIFYLFRASYNARGFWDYDNPGPEMAGWCDEPPFPSHEIVRGVTTLELRDVDFPYPWADTFDDLDFAGWIDDLGWLDTGVAYELTNGRKHETRWHKVEETLTLQFRMRIPGLFTYTVASVKIVVTTPDQLNSVGVIEGCI